MLEFPYSSLWRFRAFSSGSYLGQKSFTWSCRLPHVSIPTSYLQIYCLHTGKVLSVLAGLTSSPQCRHCAYRNLRELGSLSLLGEKWRHISDFTLLAAIIGDDAYGMYENKNNVYPATNEMGKKSLPKP